MSFFNNVLLCCSNGIGTRLLTFGLCGTVIVVQSKLLHVIDFFYICFQVCTLVLLFFKIIMDMYMKK
jgi:hypothetical protein